MADPTAYSVTYSFAGWQAHNPTLPLPAQRVDVEFQNIESAIGGLVNSVTDVRRSDGALQNNIVTYESLSTELQSAGLAPLTPWLTATDYPADKVVINGASIYAAVEAHTSGVFVDDLNDGLWSLMATLPAGPEGDPGESATITVGIVSTLANGQPATVTNVGDVLDAIFNFGIPAGPAGTPGAAATITVGDVTTVASGQPATVTNVGTSSAAIFDIEIPAGEDGEDGDGAGDVVGPVSSVDARIAVFSGTDGKEIADGGTTIAALTSSILSTVRGGASAGFDTLGEIETDLGNKQPLDSFLTSIASLGTAADKIIYTTAANTAAEAPLTSQARALIDDASFNAMLTTLTATRTETGNAAVPVLTKLREHLSVTDFGAVGDGRLVTGGSGMTSGSPTLVAAAASFTPADVGKKIAVNAAGAAAVALVTTISAYVSNSTVTLADNAGATVGSTYAMLGTDNTTPINNAIAAAKVAGGHLFFPNGTFVCGKIAFNSAVGVHVYGVGKQSGAGPTNYGTHIWPLIAAGDADIAVDMTGSTHCSLNMMQIGRSDLLGQATVGVFVAAKSGTESTNIDMVDVFVIGLFTTAALYQFGVPDCAYTRCQFYNYRNHGSANAVVLTATNIRSITSDLETVNGGTLDTSNVKFINTHIIEQGNAGGVSSATAMLLDSSANTSILGCNIFSTKDCIAIADQDASSGTRALTIANTVCNGGTNAPEHVVRIDTTHTIKGLTLDNNQYNQGDDAMTGAVSVALIQIPSGGRVDGLKILGRPVAGGSCKAVDGGGTTALHGVGWYIDCGGMPIHLPGSLEDVVLHNPGTITTIAGSTVKQAGAFEEHTICLSDESTAITTGAGKASMSLRYPFKLVGVRASLNTVSSSGAPAFDMNEAGASLLSTTVTIDASELSSDTAATPAVISDSVIAANALLTFDIDTAGTGAKGAKFTFWGFRSG